MVGNLKSFENDDDRNSLEIEQRRTFGVDHQLRRFSHTLSVFGTCMQVKLYVLRKAALRRNFCRVVYIVLVTIDKGLNGNTRLFSSLYSSYPRLDATSQCIWSVLVMVGYPSFSNLDWGKLESV